MQLWLVLIILITVPGWANYECGQVSEILKLQEIETLLVETKNQLEPGWSFHQIKSGKVYLVAAEGDSIATLIKFLGGKDNARKYVGDIVDKDIKYKPGMVVPLNFPALSGALSDVSSRPEDYAFSLLDPNLYKLDPYKHGYNCFYSALETAQGRNPAEGWRRSIKRDFQGKVISNPALMGADDFKKNLDANYRNVPASQAVFGKTLITFGFYHVALYLGKNREGKVFVLTKNGNLIVPQISAIDAFSDDEAEYFYGKPRNFTLDNLMDGNNRLNPGGKFGSGYYNPK